MKKFLQFFEDRQKLTFMLAILWTIVIFIGCSMPGRDLPKVNLFDNFDKVVHFTFFAVFFGLWFLITSKSTKYALVIIVISIFYGFSIEYYQLYCVAGRGFDVWDGVADGLGALCGWWVIRGINSAEVRS
ncbi:MAG: VanZ family protein [Bacteroidetes bacterium]|nr:VanZ family protein [Bacteroidota bacterium]